MAEKEPVKDEPGLTVYNQGNDDFLRKIASMKGMKEGVREEASTDPESLERKRQEIGVLLKFTRDNVNDIRRLRKELADLPNNDENKTRRDEIAEQVKGFLTENMMLTSLGSLYAQATLIDCLTVREEGEKDTEKGKKKTYQRIGIADILYNAFEDPDECINFVDEEDFMILLDMLHGMAKGMVKMLAATGADTKDILGGDVVDEFGMTHFEPDRFEYAKKKNLERQLREAAEAKARASGAVTEEDIAEIRKMSLDDFLRISQNGDAK